MASAFYLRAVAPARACCGHAAARSLSTAAPPTASTAASAAAGAITAPHTGSTLPVPTHAYASAQGKTVSMPWARFNITPSDGVDPAYARKVAVLSMVTDAPAVRARRAIVYKVGQSAMTSGPATSRSWAIRFNHVDKWSNPLMGWISSADTQAPVAMHMRFESAEAALLACERNGWDYELQVPHERRAGQVDNQYSYNFVPRDVAYKMSVLGPRRSTRLFANAHAGSAAWVNFRHTAYGPDAWRPADYQTPSAWTGPDWPQAKAAAGGH